jgi:uncharacterized membrane protein
MASADSAADKSEARKQLRESLEQLGQGVLLGLVASAVAATPGALRASDQAPLWACYLAALGGTASVIAPAAGGLRAARPFPAFTSSALYGLLLAIVPLIVLATLLKEKTHHRPLGAATFAVASLVVLAGAIAVAARLMNLARTGSHRQRTLSRFTLLFLAAASALTSTLLLLRGFAAMSPLARSALFDGALMLGLGFVAAVVRVPRVASVARLGRRTLPIAVVLWAAMLVVASLALRQHEPRSALETQAPALLGVLRF